MSPAAVLLLAALAAPTAPSARDASPRGRFIVGSPGPARPRRRPARRRAATSASSRPSAPTPTSTSVVDATWLRHEVEGYARRAARLRPAVTPGAVRAGAAPPRGRDRDPPGARRARRDAVDVRAAAPSASAGDGRCDADRHDDRRRAAGRLRGGAAGRVSEPISIRASASIATWADDEIERRLYYVGQALEDGDAAGDDSGAPVLRRAPGCWRVERRPKGSGDERAPDGRWRSATPITVRDPARGDSARAARQRGSARAATAMPWCAAPPLA